ncbi:MAG: type II toxin-antitoxin system VapC family toxin [Actinomycetes bacterium]
MSEKLRAYVETTVVSYLVARPSRNVRVAAHQEITADWWTRRRATFDLCVSQFVVDEAAAGDVSAAPRRLSVLREIPKLELTPAALRLAADLVTDGAIPREAGQDALHVAVATVHGMHPLLTWNCRHIANASLRNRIIGTCARSGCEAPVICTPEELLEN